jgi:nitroreductase
MTDGALSRQTAERLIETATAAPSMHNSQPWRFVARLADRVIEIYADPTRTLRRGDPRGRGVQIACGSALFNLRLAIAQAGSEPVARLLPSPRNPLLLASVRLAGPYRPRPAERDLYAAIRHQPTCRGPANGHPVPRALLAALQEAAALEGATLRLLDQADALRILRTTPAADPGLRTDPRYLAELAASTGGLRHGTATVRAMGNGHPGGRLVMRDLPVPPDGRRLAPTVSEGTPLLAVISTGSGDRATWLRAGQATQRVLLLAARRGLHVTPLTPVLEEQEATLRTERYLNGEHPAMIVRLGLGRPGQATRRPVAQVLRVVPPVIARQSAGLAPGTGLAHDTDLAQDKSPAQGPPPALSPGDRQLMTSK